MKLLKTLAVGAAAAGVLAAAPAVARDIDYILNTAPTGGAYHSAGAAIAALSKEKLLPKRKFSLTAVSSAGSRANVKALGADAAQFAIVQGLFGSYAATGTGPISKPQKNLRSVTMLWRKVEQFVIDSRFVKGGTASDLVAMKGQAMAFGRQNSPAFRSSRALLKGLGLDMDKDFELVYAGYGPSVDALANGQVAGIGGRGHRAIAKLLAANAGKFTILNVTPEEGRKMDGGRNLWVPHTIKAGTYPDQDEDIRTIAQPHFLAVNADVPEEHVYLLTKAIYENLPFLRTTHKATRAMDVKKATAGLPAPLHPGALRYYKEVGVPVADHLMAK